jgi:hypothetical protein
VPALGLVGSVARAITRVFSLSGNLTYQSGTPFSVLGNSTRNAFFAQVSRVRVSFAPGMTIADATKSGRVQDRLDSNFNVAAFQDSLDQWGNTGRNILRGPSQVQLDLVLARAFPLTPRQRLEVRWEVYNALNTPVFANPQSTFAANGYGTAGQITSTIGGPRTMQIAARFAFLNKVTSNAKAAKAAKTEVNNAFTNGCSFTRVGRRRSGQPAGCVLVSQRLDQPGRAVTDPGVITTRQAITPAGVQSVFDGRGYASTFGETDEELWVLTGRTRNGQPPLYQLDWLQNHVRNQWELTGTPALQGLVFDPVRKSPLIGITIPPRDAGGRAGGAVQLLRYNGASFVPLASDLGRHLAGAPALARGSLHQADAPFCRSSSTMRSQSSTPKRGRSAPGSGQTASRRSAPC